MTENKKEDKKIKFGTLLRNNIFLFRLACKYAPLYVALTVVDGVVWGINNAIELYYTKMLFSWYLRIERLLLCSVRVQDL